MLKFKLAQSPIPYFVRDFDIKNHFTYLDDVFQSKEIAIKCILAVHYRNVPLKDHSNLIDELIQKCDEFLELGSRKQELQFISNRVFFGKMTMIEGLNEFTLEELEVYAY